MIQHILRLFEVHNFPPQAKQTLLFPVYPWAGVILFIFDLNHHASILRPNYLIWADRLAECTVHVLQRLPFFAPYVHWDCGGQTYLEGLRWWGGRGSAPEVPTRMNRGRSPVPHRLSQCHCHMSCRTLFQDSACTNTVVNSVKDFCNWNFIIYQYTYVVGNG